MHTGISLSKSYIYICFYIGEHELSISNSKFGDWKLVKVKMYRLKQRSILVRKVAWFGNPQEVKQSRVIG